MARFLPGKSMPSIAKLMPAKMPSPSSSASSSDAGTASPGGYTPPPTERDLSQSIVHHVHSSAFDLQHAKTHNDSALRALNHGDIESARYNIQHSDSHLGDGAGHADAALDRMSSTPRFQPHVQALGDRMDSPRGGGMSDVGDGGDLGSASAGPPPAPRSFRKTQRAFPTRSGGRR